MAQHDQQLVLLSSLHAAVEALTVCVERVEDLIAQVHVMVETNEPLRQDRRARAGTLTAGARRPDPAPASRRTAAPRNPSGPRPSTPALMAATELIHQGYSHEEIAERMRQRWGREAAQILRELIE